MWRYVHRQQVNYLRVFYTFILYCDLNLFVLLCLFSNTLQLSLGRHKNLNLITVQTTTTELDCRTLFNNMYDKYSPNDVPLLGWLLKVEESRNIIEVITSSKVGNKRFAPLSWTLSNCTSSNISNLLSRSLV